jgi:hypothetical protein
MIGLNLYFRSAGKKTNPFPVFGTEFITAYDKSVDTNRLHVRDAFRNDLGCVIEQCENQRYRLLGFHFAVDREKLGFDEAVAAEIGYQDFGFFEDSDDKTWRGNEHRKVEISDGAAIVEVANQYVFVEELAQALQRIRKGLDWRPVATIDRYNRKFLRLVTHPEHAFLSPATVVGNQWTLLWVAGSAEPPDDLFFDRVAIGAERAFYPLVASRGIVLDLSRRFPQLPFTPIFGCNSAIGKAIVRVCELLKSHINPVDTASETEE